MAELKPLTVITAIDGEAWESGSCDVVSATDAEAREKLLADALKACVNIMIIKRRVASDAATVEDLNYIFSGKDYKAENRACDLLAQFDAEEHQ